MRTESFPPARVDLVMVDAMFCLLEGRQNNHERSVAAVYRSTGKLTSRDRSLIRAIAIARRQFSKELLDDDYWLHVNLAVMRALDPARKVGNQADAAQRIHQRLLSDPSLYKVQVTLLSIVRRLRQRGTRVVIASNQQEDRLRKLLKHFDLQGEVDAVYTSEALGVRKPNGGFWEQILQKERVASTSALHIGNSMRSDVGAATVGIQTIIWDSKGEAEKCRREPDKNIAGLDAEQTAIVRENLCNGRIVPFASLSALRRQMEQEGLL